MRVFSKMMLILVGLTLALPVYAEGTHSSSSAPSAMVLLGKTPKYKPLTSYTFRGISLEAPLSLAARLEGLNSFPVDRNQVSLETGLASDIQARVGIKFNTGLVLKPVNLALVYEHDVVTGALSGKPDGLGGEGYTNSHGIETHLRKAYVRASLGYLLHLTGGFMTSHWGLGLMANDGAHGWHPGSAHFADPRGGDRTIRVMLASGPLTHLGLVVALGHDWVRHDDVMLEGDSARQIVGAVTLGHGKPTTLGFYGVSRRQEAVDGDTIEVGVVDMYFRTTHELRSDIRLTVELETALVLGETTLAPSPSNPTKDILQVGAAFRASLDAGKLGAVLDFLFASGDSNFDDSQQNNFNADPNYEMSLFLYRYVMSGQTGRAPFTASDRTIVGYPSEDLDRLPTRERTTNTIAIFPRLWWRPLGGLEIYGGPLIAFTAVPLADPYNSRLAGGDPRNALNGEPGRYLGTELDFGIRFRMIMAGTQFTAGLEGGVLLPGDALQLPDGTVMDPVGGARLLVRYRF